MPSNNKLTRAPKNPMSDEVYEERYGGKPCDACQNVGRVCKDVNGNPYVTALDSNMKPKVVDSAKKRKMTDFSDNEDEEDLQESGLNRAVKRQRVVQSGVLGYAEQGVNRGPSITQQDPHEGPIYPRAEGHLSNPRIHGQPRDAAPVTHGPSQWDQTIDRICDYTGDTDATRAKSKAQMNEPYKERLMSCFGRIMEPDKYLWADMQDKPAKATRPARGTRNQPPAREVAKSKKPSEREPKDFEHDDESDGEVEG
ncbi:hypothetical protein IFR05_013843 [Cadophora sp. M221]|nr:hypothetical protein IFR05_013843 [Cadophora sp. M221]